MKKYLLVSLLLICPLFSSKGCAVLNLDTSFSTNFSSNRLCNPSKVKAKHLQPTIECLSFSEEEVELDPSLEKISSYDKGYKKYLLKSHDFPLNQTFTFSMKRLFSSTPEKFEKQGEFFTENDAHNIFAVLSSKGYVLGERIVCRCSNPQGKTIRLLA